MPDTLRDRLRLAYSMDVERRDVRELPDWKLAERGRFLEWLRNEGLCKLLEIGSGVGRDAAYFKEHGMRITCIDLSPEMVRCCQRKGLAARVMDVANLCFDHATFDAVYSINCLLHVPKDELPAALAEIRRVLRPGGIFYYGTWGGFDHEGIFEEDHLQPPRLFSFHSDVELQKLARGCFEILEFRSEAHHPEESRFRFQSLLLRPIPADPIIHGGK